MFNNRVWKSHLYTDRKQPQAVFCKKSCFYKFRKIYRKTPVPESQPATLLKRKLWHRCFCVNFAKLLRACNFVKKGPWHRCFPMNFAKFLRTPFHRTSLNDCFSTIQHFLAENPNKVLNGQQQHKGVTFHWSRISPSLVKLF